MYFYTTSSMLMASLAEAVTRADAEGRCLRIEVTDDGSIKWKVGEGGWSPPWASTPNDPYRDEPKVTSADLRWMERHGTD